MDPNDLTPDERQLLVSLADFELEPWQVDQAFSACPTNDRSQRPASARERLRRLVDLGLVACTVVHYDRAGPHRLTERRSVTVPAARVHPHWDDPRLWDRDGAAALLRDGPDGDHVVVCFIPTALGERLLDALFGADGR